MKAWESAHELTLDVDRLTAEFPSDERFGLIAQIRRACASIPTNIAHGCGRNTEPELSQFIDIATGSTSEVEF